MKPPSHIGVIRGQDPFISSGDFHLLRPHRVRITWGILGNLWNGGQTFLNLYSMSLRIQECRRLRVRDVYLTSCDHNMRTIPVTIYFEGYGEVRQAVKFS